MPASVLQALSKAVVDALPWNFAIETNAKRPLSLGCATVAWRSTPKHSSELL